MRADVYVGLAAIPADSSSGLRFGAWMSACRVARRREPTCGGAAGRRDAGVSGAPGEALFRSSPPGRGGERANIPGNGIRRRGASVGSLVLRGLPISEICGDPPGWPIEVPDLLRRRHVRPAQARATRSGRPRQASRGHSAASLILPADRRGGVPRHKRLRRSGPTLFPPWTGQWTSVRKSCGETASA